MENNKSDLELLNENIESINEYIRKINEKGEDERREAYKNIGKLSGAFIKSIDVKEQTEWEAAKRKISSDIRNDLINQLAQYKKDFNNFKKKNGEFYFLDYCNCIKSLLAIYNFGSLGNFSSQEIASDKQDIKEGIATILTYIGDDNRYEISSETMLSGDDCREIVDADGNTIPVTLALTTVMTTLTYLRRAMVRNDGLFTKKELNDVPFEFYDKYALDDDGNKIKISLFDKIVETFTEILAMLYGYVLQGDNRYSGWGFTIKSKSVTLNDTYAVVDAISRYLDAFTKDGKRDEDFLKAIDDNFKKNIEHYSGYGNFKENTISEKILDAMFNVAFVTYEKTREVYGSGIFYAEGQEYSETSYEQIANSNRSSALFNPLYVAMITMYGYNDKEVVIRKFMDDVALMTKYYKKYEGLNTDGTCVTVPSEDDPTKLVKVEIKEEDKLSYYASTLEWFNKGDADGKDFNNEIRSLYFAEGKQDNGVKKSVNYNRSWRRYYNVARVFQKYLEEKHPEELLEISVYREYLNATRDAIDQVQVMYRKFNDSQKLGIVDTDYQMFNSADIEAEPSTLSKLNKANIAVNSLRPLLLSAKILIVNALIKYPQKDMEELYEAIKASKYSKRVRDKKKTDTVVKWLWNEDRINMNSTARHCEAIMYDYFDYFEKYELGFRAISRIKGDVDLLTTQGISSKTGTFSNKDDNANPFINLVMEMTQNNIGTIQNVFNASREQAEKDNEADKLKIEANHRAELDLKNKRISKLEEEKKNQEADIHIGEQLKEWIREETEKYLTETLSYMILKKLNFRYDDEVDEIAYRLKSHLFHCNFAGAKELGENLQKGINSDDGAEVAKARVKIKTLKDRANLLTPLFEGSFNGILDTNVIYNDTIEVKDYEYNESLISENYNRMINKRREEAPDKSSDGEENK